MTETYFDIIIKEILYLIHPNLNGPDAYQFAELYNLNMEIYTAKAIENKLKILFEEDYTEVKKFMEDNNVVISGSYILETLLNEEYNTDIDFYLLTDFGVCDPNDVYLTKNFPKIKLPNIQMQEDKDKHIYQYMNGLNITYIYTYKYKGKLIQFICLNNIIRKTENVYDDIWNYIVYAFDFNVCKLMYYFNKGHYFANIYDIKNIYNKLIILQNVNTFTVVGRLKKYISRGFKIYNDTNTDYFNRLLALEALPEYLSTRTYLRLLICDDEETLRKNRYDEVHGYLGIDKYKPRYFITSRSPGEVVKSVYILVNNTLFINKCYPKHLELKCDEDPNPNMIFYAYKYNLKILDL